MSTPSRKEKIEAMLADAPADPLLRYMLAMEHVSGGDDRAAVACFRETIARSADYVPAYMQLGQALARLGQLAEARAAWKTGVGEASRKNDLHAAQEMQGMIDSLE
jgi:predicted Zn-dependent protease